MVFFIILSMFVFSSSLGANDPEIEWVAHPLAKTPHREGILAKKLRKELLQKKSPSSGPLNLPSLTETDDLMIKETLTRTLAAKVGRGEFTNNERLLKIWKCIQVFLGQRDSKVDAFNKQVQAKGFEVFLKETPDLSSKRFQALGEDANFFEPESFEKRLALQQETLNREGLTEKVREALSKAYKISNKIYKHLFPFCTFAAVKTFGQEHLRPPKDMNNLFTEHYGTNVPLLAHAELIKAFLSPDDKVLAVCSGNGLWEAFLQQQGIDIVATDLKPGYRGFGPCYTDVEKRDAFEAMEHYQDRKVLFVSLAEDNIAKNIVETFPGNKLIFISFCHEEDITGNWKLWQPDNTEIPPVLPTMCADPTLAFYERSGEEPGQDALAQLIGQATEILAGEECKIS